jgi:hypothetical protein
MFKVQFTVEDKHLASVMRLLQGRPYLGGLEFIPTDEPKTGTSSKLNRAKKPYKRGPYKRAGHRGVPHLKGQGATQVIREFLATVVGSQTKASDMAKAAAAKGYARGAYSNPLKILVKDGTLKPLGFGHYEITSKKAEAPQQAG